MELFLKRTRGSITVMVTLILVPTIFFTGFLVDLARMKLYGNQALMTADNYGEAVISDYDNLLKELYGLFAVTQSSEGKAALDELKEYMETSFHPNENTISQQYFQAAQEKWGWSTEYDGFMPYDQAEVTMSYSPAAGANLGTEEVMTTQIGDFMKFRIAQQLMDDGEAIIDAIETVENSEGEAEVVDAKTELDDQAGEVLEKAKDYYKVLDAIQGYPGFIAGINHAYDNTKKTFEDVRNSGSYKTYYNYVTHKDEIDDARDKEANLGEGESLSSDEEKLIAMGDAYDNDEDARREKFKEKLDNARADYVASGISEPDDYFQEYDSLVSLLKTNADKVQKEIGTLQTLKEELERKLAENTVDSDVEAGIRDDINQLEKLFGSNGDFSADNYVNLANEIYQKNIAEQDVNNWYLNCYVGTCDAFQETENDLLNCSDPVEPYEEPIDESLYYNFQGNSSYNALYLSLKESFSGDGDTSEQEKKKNEANNKLKEKEEAMSGDETTTARNIPESLGLGSSGTEGNFALTNMIKEAVSYFKLGSEGGVGQVGNRLLLKFYTVSYDFGMFSSRITNVKSGESSGGEDAEEEAVSLTGVKMGRNVNYLYGAELEYLLGGYNSSVQNLNLARNRILAFRAVINMQATFKISAINTPIKAIKDACSAINPILGIAVAAALRAAVAGIETYGDWEKLKKGESVVLIKSQLSDLNAANEIGDLLGENISSSGSSNGLKLNYDQYLMIMAVFMTTADQVASRTGNLITLNMNTVQQKIGTSGTLSNLTWKMGNAVTAVDATCAVHLDFVVMPDNFAEQVISSDTLQGVQSFEKNTYKFTVTRGY